MNSFQKDHFYTRGGIIRPDELGEIFCSSSGYVSSTKTGKLRVMRPDEPSFVIRLERRTTKGSSPGRKMRLVPVFILETHNQTNHKIFAQVRPEG